MNELWSRSVASVYDGKVEDFKRLAADLVSTIRENDSETLNHAIFLDEPARVAVMSSSTPARRAGSRMPRTSTG